MDANIDFNHTLLHRQFIVCDLEAGITSPQIAPQFITRIYFPGCDC